MYNIKSYIYYVTRGSQVEAMLPWQFFFCKKLEGRDDKIENQRNLKTKKTYFGAIFTLTTIFFAKSKEILIFFPVKIIFLYDRP